MSILDRRRGSERRLHQIAIVSPVGFVSRFSDGDLCLSNPAFRPLLDLVKRLRRCFEPELERLVLDLLLDGLEVGLGRAHQLFPDLHVHGGADSIREAVYPVSQVPASRQDFEPLGRVGAANLPDQHGLGGCGNEGEQEAQSLLLRVFSLGREPKPQRALFLQGANFQDARAFEEFRQRQIERRASGAWSRFGAFAAGENDVGMTGADAEDESALVLARVEADGPLALDEALGIVRPMGDDDAIDVSSLEFWLNLAGQALQLSPVQNGGHTDLVAYAGG